ncbi:MAG: hypothetical protein RB292_00535 [Patescibacteria group bacterium]|jgi:hypothetical protein|nr:hypothetical protein [Patescibacteria group bacterium]
MNKPIVGHKILKALEGFEAGLGDDASIQPAILANRNFDPSRVVAAWGGYLNDAWTDKIQAKIQEGFTVVRIQTEWTGKAHRTMIYLVKLSAE